MSVPKSAGRAATVLVTTAAVAAATISVLTGSDQPIRSSAMSVEVVAVIDGDTVRVESLDGIDLGRVRLLGIDAPELAYEEEAADCFAHDARRHLRELLGRGVLVELTADAGEPDRDVYGRLLRYLDVGGVDVAEAMLAQGAARRYPGQLERGRAYEDAAARALAAKAGLHFAC